MEQLYKALKNNSEFVGFIQQSKDEIDGQSRSGLEARRPLCGGDEIDESGLRKPWATGNWFVNMYIRSVPANNIGLCYTRSYYVLFAYFPIYLI